MNHYTYILTNLVNGKQYVGDRSCICDPKNDPYLGSGRPYLSRAKNKYGYENFKKDILEIFETRQEAFDAQEKYIEKYKTLVPNGYNVSIMGGYGSLGSVLNKETKRKISKSSRGKKLSQEIKRKIGEANKISLLGNKIPEEVKIKISKTTTGKKLSKETKIKMSKAKKGQVFSDESRQKMSNAKKGRSWEIYYDNDGNKKGDGYENSR